MPLWRIYVRSNQTCSSLHVKCLVFLSNFNQILSFSTHFCKSLCIKLHGNMSSGSCSDTCEHTDGQMDEQTDMMKLIGALHSCANMPKTE